MKNVKSHRNTPGKYWEIDLSSSICPGKSVQVWAGHTNFTQWLRFKLGTALLPWECLMLFSKVVLDNYYPTSVYWWENAPLVVKLFSGWQNCNFKKASCTKWTRLKTESVQVFHPVSKCYVKAPTRLISQKSPLCSTILFLFFFWAYCFWTPAADIAVFAAHLGAFTGGCFQAQSKQTPKEKKRKTLSR